MIEADGASSEDPTPDPALVKAVARGHAWFEDLVSGRATSVLAIARREGLTPRYVSRLLELAFLPPKLVEAILAGTQPAHMTAETLTRGERGVVWSAVWVPNASERCNNQRRKRDGRSWRISRLRSAPASKGLQATAKVGARGAARRFGQIFR